MSVTALLVLFVCLKGAASQLLFANVTDPPTTDANPAVIAEAENTTNVTLFCHVVRDGVGTRFNVWSLKRGSETIFLSFNSTTGEGRDGAENFLFTFQTLGGISVPSTLTIRVFNESFDMASITCGAGVDVAVNGTFQLRIIKPPVLRRETTAMAAVENMAFSFNIEQSAGFPLVPSYQWYHDGMLIDTDTSINPNVSDYPQIVFSSVMRSDSGNYSMIATTEGGNSTGYFILDVQYGVEAIDETNDQFCVVEGGNATLVAFTNITGNPDPSSSWELIGGTLMGVNTTSRELTITNAVSSGNYTNTLSNNVSGTINQINRTVELRVLNLPTAPRSIAVINLTDDSSTSIILRWQNPLTSGVPAFNAFLVELVSMNPPFINVTRSFNAISTDPSYTNTFTVTGLKPNTNYTASVRAVSPQLDMSCMEQGVAHSQPSNTVAFMTRAGDPEFSATNLVNTNGKLVVTWSFRHTGGAPLTSVAVTCRSEEEGSGSGLASDMSCSANMCGDGMAVIPTGPENVTAGMNYSCTITATNELGNSERQTTNYILATSGVPSVPMITDVTVGIQLFTVTVRVFAGHTSLYFNVSVMNEQNNVVKLLDTQPGVPSGPMNYTIAVPFTQSGRHRFTVSASNPFGRSASESDMYPPPDRNGLEVIMPSSTRAVPSATSTSVTQPTSTVTTEPPMSSGLGAGVVAAIVIVLIAVILVVVVVVIIVGFILYKNKGDTYKVDNKKVVVEELDIDIGTELKPATSDSPPPAQPAPAEPVVTYSAVGANNSEPQAELHYADLQDFKKVDRTKRPVNKPAPIEEVQYAVINPKSLQKPPEPAKHDGDANGEAAAAGEETQAQTSTTFI